MLRRLVLAITALLVFVCTELTLVGSSTAAPPATPSTDPTIDVLSPAYSPVVWANYWNPTGQAYGTLASKDAETNMEATGLLVYPNQVQWKALDSTDQATVTTAWQQGLLPKVWRRAQTWMTAAYAANFSAPEWSTPDSDQVAQMLGSPNYSSLTPGLKGVVQRIATVVTGDRKPTMPDSVWESWMPADVRAAFDAASSARFDWRKVNVSQSYTGAVISQCDAGILNWACEAVNKVADTVGATVSFLSDPLGWLVQKTASAATSVITWMSSTANAATQPDLTADWWISAYEKGMAIGIILFGLVLLWQFILKARGKIDATQFFEIMMYRVPGFFAGLVFGPPLAQFLLAGSRFLSDDLINSWAPGTDASFTAMQKSVTAASTGQLTGGLFVALIFLVLIIICGLFVFIALAVQAVAVYLSSVVFGIAFAWFVSAHHNGTSMRIPFLFVGLVFSRPLLFLMLGAGLGLVDKSISMQDDLTRNLATLIMAVVVLAMAGFAPLLLLKFAPVSPHGMDASTGVSGGALGGTAGAGRAAGSAGSRLAQMASSPTARMAAAGGRGISRAAGAVGAGVAAMTGRGGGGGPVAMAAGGAAGGIRDGGASATSKASRLGDASTLSGQLLGRSRRHGGGNPSPAAARLAKTTAAAERLAASEGNVLPPKRGSRETGLGASSDRIHRQRYMDRAAAGEDAPSGGQRKRGSGKAPASDLGDGATVNIGTGATVNIGDAAGRRSSSAGPAGQPRNGMGSRLAGAGINGARNAGHDVTNSDTGGDQT